MSLQGSLAKFKSEYADATSRNVSQSRPTAPARVSTPKPSTPAPATVDLTKRSHEVAFPASSGGSGTELLSQVNYAVGYLKSKNPQALPFDELIRHMSLPLDAQKNIPHIRTALAGNERVQFISKSESGTGHDGFRYRPQHPVTNSEELKNYLARQITARGIPVKELKDGWPGCIPAIDALEKEGAILVTRLTKDNTPKMVWPDSPSYHVHIDDDFREFWNKTKLPPTEGEIRSELEKAGLTPTSQVKEVKKLDNKKKDRKRPNRRGGMKTTNSHMAGILKDYNKR
jgi:transcription initiation factor TFIIE subunit beta